MYCERFELAALHFGIGQSANNFTTYVTLEVQCGAGKRERLRAVTYDKIEVRRIASNLNNVSLHGGT